MPAAESKIELRRKFRQRRRELDQSERRRAAQAMADQLFHTRLFRSGRRIACYLPADGEIDTSQIIERIHRLGKQCYLPVLSRIGHDRLWFAQTKRTRQRLTRNRYGINEPLTPACERVRAQQLDLILIPLVGFDEAGHRLGMGGGYYDRSLAFLLSRSRWRRPHLIGLAFDCQKTPRLIPDSWDVPIDAVVTEMKIYSVST